MKRSEATYMACIRAKSNAHYICQECGSTEMIQAHHQIPGDDNSIIVLCAECHSKKHPDLPKMLFFTRNHQPYWENISAASLAKELHRHPRTIYRIAKKLNIRTGILTDNAKAQIKEALYFQPNTFSNIKNPKRIVFTTFTCTRCGHTWIPRRFEIPKRCAKCKSPYWDKEKIKK